MFHATLVLCIGVSLAAPKLATSQTFNSSAATPPVATETLDHLVVVRVSSEVLRLRDRSKTQITHSTRVHEVVLGTPAVGTAHVNGNLSVDFFPDRDDAGLWLRFTGRSLSRTVSCRQPAIIHSIVTTQFVSQKPILFDLERGFRYGQANSRVRVVAAQRSVQSTVGGLRGRLVRRVAYRRLSALSGYLNHVAEQSTTRRIERSFDRQADAQLALLNAAFHTLRLALQEQASQGTDEEYDVSLNSTDRYLQIGVGPKGMPNPRLPIAGVPPLPVQVGCTPLSSVKRQCPC